MPELCKVLSHYSWGFVANNQFAITDILVKWSYENWHKMTQQKMLNVTKSGKDGYCATLMQPQLTAELSVCQSPEG